MFNLQQAARTQRFRLDRAFVDSFRYAPAPFGFGALGELVYLRTYSRLKDDGAKEAWHETVERVVNGTYEMQRQWVEANDIGWKPAKAQRSAQEMYRRIFALKFSPPGRGLWAMGSPLTEERRMFAALNNCAFVSTAGMAREPAKPFTFLMDASMLGIGVGFDTRGAGTCVVRGPCEGPATPYTIPDTREGWVESLQMLLEAHFLERPPPDFSYDAIRPAGRPIRGFGGVSSGPGALRRMHVAVDEVLARERGTPVSVTAIVDIMNHIGVCVVAGNVRRSAEISFGDPDCDEYIDLKNYDINPQRMEYGWSSNNSVFATLGMDYERVCERVRANGEPGFAWLENMRCFGRMGHKEDYRDMRAAGGNPCVPESCIVMTDEGPRPVRELINKPFRAVVDNGVYDVPGGFFATGERPLVEVRLVSGRRMHLTGNHEVLCVHAEGGAMPVYHRRSAMKAAAALEPGVDCVVMDDARGRGEWCGSGGSFDEGWLAGVYIVPHEADTTMDDEAQCLTTNAFKRAAGVDERDAYLERLFNERGLKLVNKTDRVVSASSEFQRGFVRGLFARFGAKTDTQLLFTLQNRHLLDIAQRCLLHFGVVSRLTKAADVLGGLSPETSHAEGWVLLVGGVHVDTYRWRVVRGETRRVRGDAPPDAFIDMVESVHDIFIGVNVPVFDCTVEGLHRFVADGVVVSNCLEQTLEPYEMCCLVETFPARHESKEDFLRTLKFAYLYAKTVTLGKTHWPETNRVMLRNRRIGCSMSGIAQFLALHGIEALRCWCNEGYETIQKYDRIYREWLGIPVSIKTTSIKPSGTVSLLAGATPGMHYPVARYYIRRVRMPRDSELLPALAAAGLRIEPAVGQEATTVCVEFPVDAGPGVRPAADVSMWEQLALAAFLQEHWSDNQVSCTVSFDPEREGAMIQRALQYFQYRLKGVSFMPTSDHKYAQLPYEPITEERYRELAAATAQPNYRAAISSSADGVGDKFCDGDSCMV